MKKIKVYHGTSPKHVNNIEINGLIGESRLGANWYMVSTDFESALFHANSDNEEGNAVVIEFEVPIEVCGFFKGEPYLWEPYYRGVMKNGEGSSWYAIKNKIPTGCITKIHEVPYKEYKKQKSDGFQVITSKKITNSIIKKGVKR